MLGAHNKSIDHAVPSRFRLVSRLGSRREFDALLNTAERHGYRFFVEGDFVNMRGNGAFNGFSVNRDAARQVNRDRVRHAGYSHIVFAENVSYSVLADPVIVARPEYTVSLVRDFVKDAARYGVYNISFRSMASALGGDFHEKRHVTRESAMHMRKGLLAELQSQGTGIWLNYGYSYAVPYADVITGMPVSCQDFGVTDAAVPFYQIALHGLVHFAGSPLNLSEDYSIHLLRSVEAGASLFFSFMTQPVSEIEPAKYRRFFSNEYSRWIDTANNLYHDHNAVFAPLYNQLIIGHSILDDGVTVTVYEDGTRVYVNTSMRDYDGDGFVLPSRRYVVRVAGGY
jgi:RNase P protein component